MLTLRGFRLLVLDLALLGLGVFISSYSLVYVTLTMFLWFLAQALQFQWTWHRLQKRVTVDRSLISTRGTVRSLWAGQRAEVRLRINGHGIEMPYVLVSDYLPAPAQCQSGTTEIEGSLAQILEMNYEILALAPGRLRFAGIRLQVADGYGLFCAVRFLRQPYEVRVLPRLAVKATHPSYVKRRNVLPILGNHRHPRPGSGSELLDLRDYLPGDPPKQIAWKASARRDRLMTKEYECEVPIRVTLFLDISSAVRLGPVGKTALVRLVNISAGVAQANSAEHDLTGLCLIDEEHVVRWLRPGRGARHELQLLDLLTAVSGLLPQTPAARLKELLPIAYGLAQDLYPEYLSHEINSFPFWLPWWSPQPNWTIPLPTLKFRSVWSMPWVWLLRRLRRPIGLQLRRRLLPSAHRHYRWRKQLAALLAVTQERGPNGLAYLLEDDLACSLALQEFLAEHQVAFPCPLYDDAGRYLFHSSAKIEVLANALLAAVARGRDNELFVLAADLLEAGPDLDRLEQAIRVTLARHHQIVLIAPWPLDVPLPGESIEPTEPLPTLLLQASTSRLHHVFAQLQRRLGRLGIPVIAASDIDTVDLILHRLQRIRSRQRGFR